MIHYHSAYNNNAAVAAPDDDDDNDDDDDDNSPASYLHIHYLFVSSLNNYLNLEL